MANSPHRILGHGWQPGSRIPIDLAVEHGGRVCYVRRIGTYRYMGYLSYFDVSLNGKMVKFGGPEMHDPIPVDRMPRDADCNRRP